MSAAAGHGPGWVQCTACDGVWSAIRPNKPACHALPAPLLQSSECLLAPNRHRHCCTLPLSSAPSLAVNAAKTNFTTTELVVTPPTLAPAGGWLSYKLHICPIDPIGTCFNETCSGTPKASPQTSTCQLIGLAPGTQYSAAVTAASGAITSVESQNAVWQTLVE